MSLDLYSQIETLSKISVILESFNRANFKAPQLETAASKLCQQINNFVCEGESGVSFTAGDKTVIDLTQAGPVEEKQTVKKETAPKATPKKVTAAAIIDDKPEVKIEEPALEVEEEVSLTDDEPEESLTGETIDYVELRTECRALINSAVDRVGKPAVVAILDYIHAKSLKDVKDTLLPWLRTKLTEAK